VVMIRMDATLTLVALAIIPLLILLIMSISGASTRFAGGARRQGEPSVHRRAERARRDSRGAGFTREGESYREFVESSSASLDATLRLYTLQTLYAGAVGVLIACGTALVILPRRAACARRPLTIATSSSYHLPRLALAPVNQISQTYGQIEGAKAWPAPMPRVAGDRSEIKDRAGAQTLPRAARRNRIRQRRVRLQPGRTVSGRQLQGFAGETIAIVGPSGSGKTTMASLLARFYEPQDGAIKIDGNDTRLPHARFGRGNIAMVLQPPLVLGDHDAGQRRVRKPAVDDASPERIRWLGFEPVLAKLPAGLDEVMGRAVTALRGRGAARDDRARVAEGRADSDYGPEPTSALDAETESMVLAAVREAMRGRTTLVIAHRLSTIQNADRILVLRDGAIVEHGSFDELLARGGFFSYLYNIQAWSAKPRARDFQMLTIGTHWRNRFGQKQPSRRFWASSVRQFSTRQRWHTPLYAPGGFCLRRRTPAFGVPGGCSADHTNRIAKNSVRSCLEIPSG